jgi:hypothetical protein
MVGYHVPPSYIRQMTKNQDCTKPVMPRAARKNQRVGNLPEETIKALKESKMDERHVVLNGLMQD